MQAPSSTCKYYTSHGSVRGLHKKGNPPPEKFGTWAWQQICKGSHPKKKEVTVQLECNPLGLDGLAFASSSSSAPPDAKLTSSSDDRAEQVPQLSNVRTALALEED